MKIPSKCERCQAIIKTRSRIVNGYGNEHSKIMFVGICPGNHLMLGGADSTGIPFKGDASGNVFGMLLEKLNIAREDVYTTNLVKCRPSTMNRLYNRPPTQEEIDNCKPFLYEEIGYVKPKLIICLGKVVYSNLKDDDENKYVKVYHFHPSFVARTPEIFDVWFLRMARDIKKWTGKTYPQTELDEYEKKNNVQ